MAWDIHIDESSSASDSGSEARVSPAVGRDIVAQHWERTGGRWGGEDSDVV